MDGNTVKTSSRADVTTFKPHVKRKIAVLSEEVFHLNVRRRILNETRLRSSLEDAILQEEYAENQKEMCKLTGMPEHEKTDLDKTREELLLRRMINIVRRRDRLLNDLRKHVLHLITWTMCIVVIQGLLLLST